MTLLFKPTSYRKGAALAVGATAAWKIVSFVNALLLASYFGADRATDLYFYLILTLGVAWFFVQRLNAAVIIPQAMALEAQTPLSSRPLLNGYLYVYLMLAAIIIGVGVLCPVQTARLFSRFDTPYLHDQHALITWGLLLFALQILSTYLLAVLEMHKRFATALFTPLNALLPLLFLMGWGRQVGVISMLYGFVLSHAIQVVVFGVMLKKELGWKFTRGEIYHSAAFMKNLASNQLIELANIVSGVLPLYLLSGLNAGVVSALNYARQLSDSSTEVLTLRVANVSKIQLTRHVAKRRWDTFNAAYNATHHFLWFLLTPLAVFSIFYAPDIITLFFKRGAFSATDVREASAFLRPLLVLVWLMAPVLMQNNVVAATRKLKEFLPYALSGILLFIVLVPGAVAWGGAVAFVYAQAGCCVVGLAINAFFFKKYVPEFGLLPALKDGARLVLYNALALLPSAFYALQFGGQNVWVRVFISGSIFMICLLALTRASGDLKRFLHAARR